MTPACIFHICTRAAAEAARASGSYHTASLDTEGFIHMSQAHQVRTVLEAFYAGQPDLVLLLVVPQLLRSPLRFEAPSTLPHAPGALLPDASQLFPHLYGALNMDAVVDVLDVAQFQGAPVHPDTAALLQHYRFERLPVEGTLYRSTWRSGSVDDPRPPAGTAMIGLYAESPRSVSCFHRLTRDEVWHVYGGDPFILYLLHPDGRSEEVLMGPDPLAGQRVQQLIPAGVKNCVARHGNSLKITTTTTQGTFTNTLQSGGADYQPGMHIVGSMSIGSMKVQLDGRGIFA
jgi:uncharacterized protein (DUF952 family)/predicted cupin superfamily sugar epimerase